jgi:O-antigen/teichoic acid export membrane protein
MLGAPSMALPLIVTSTLSATTNAFFYVASMIAGFAAMAPPVLTTALFAAGARQPHDLTRHTRFTLAVNLLIGPLAIGAVVVAGRQVLGLFGPSYVVAERSLVLLTVAVLPLTVKHHYVAICRVRGALGYAAVVMAVSAIVELGSAALGGRAGGMNGLSLGWLIALWAEAVYMAPRVLGVIAPARSAERGGGPTGLAPAPEGAGPA